MSAPQLLTNTHGERLQPEVRRVPVIQLPIVARIPLVRHNEPPAVVQTSPRQPVRNARQPPTTRIRCTPRLLPPLAPPQRHVLFHHQQIRPDEPLGIPVLRLLVLLQIPRGRAPEILAEQAAQLALGTRPLVARVGTRHSQPPSASSCS